MPVADVQQLFGDYAKRLQNDGWTVAHLQNQPDRNNSYLSATKTDNPRGWNPREVSVAFVGDGDASIHTTRIGPNGERETCAFVLTPATRLAVTLLEEFTRPPKPLVDVERLAKDLNELPSELFIGGARLEPPNEYDPAPGASVFLAPDGSGMGSGFQIYENGEIWCDSHRVRRQTIQYLYAISSHLSPALKRLLDHVPEIDEDAADARNRA